MFALPLRKGYAAVTTFFSPPSAARWIIAEDGTMNRRYITSPMLLLVLSLLSGCTYTIKAYEGPALPKDKVATLRSVTLWYPEFNYRAYTYVQKIGEANLPDDLYKTKVVGNIEFLPGSHKVEYRYVAYWGLGTLGHLIRDAYVGNVEFIAESGHTYEVYAGKIGKRLKPWVIDTTTGKVVAGEKPFVFEDIEEDYEKVQ